MAWDLCKIEQKRLFSSSLQPSIEEAYERNEHLETMTCELRRAGQMLPQMGTLVPWETSIALNCTSTQG
ncbi:hypothetical protein DMX01_05330 [Pseudomonas fulva]|nr:hypothetical protein DMX01_05330 [Pseudomonas fulva]PYC14767.1 hypothetical protein DMX00_09330 [Pseudomonas fulva]